MSAARLTKPNHHTTCQALGRVVAGTAQSQPDFLKNHSRTPDTLTISASANG